MRDDDHFEPNYWGTVASPAGFNQFITAKTFAWDNVITLSPSMVLDLRYGLAWQTNYRDPYLAGVNLMALGFPQSYVSQLQASYLPAETVTGFNGPSETANQRWSRYTHSAAASLTALRGRHTIKAGWDGRLFRDHNFAISTPSGSFTIPQPSLTARIRAAPSFRGRLPISPSRRFYSACRPVARRSTPTPPRCRSSTRPSTFR